MITVMLYALCSMLYALAKNSPTSADTLNNELENITKLISSLPRCFLRL